MFLGTQGLLFLPTYLSGDGTLGRFGLFVVGLVDLCLVLGAVILPLPLSFDFQTGQLLPFDQLPHTIASLAAPWHAEEATAKNWFILAMIVIGVGGSAPLVMFSWREISAIAPPVNGSTQDPESEESFRYQFNVFWEEGGRAKRRVMITCTPETPPGRFCETFKARSDAARQDAYERNLLLAWKLPEGWCIDERYWEFPSLGKNGDPIRRPATKR